MLERYSLSPMKEIWGEEEKYNRWLTVEIAVIKAFEDKAIAPRGIWKKILKKVSINIDDISKIEKKVDHDVIAFIKSITKNLDDEEERFFHMGLTSSDIVDTAQAMALKSSGELLLLSLDDYLASLKKIAIKNKNIITVGRTHGVHAEPTSLGLKFLNYYSETLRNKDRLKRAIENISVGKFSGAVGNYANIDPKVEELALKKLGLKPSKITTQVIQRDVHSEYVFVLALIGASIERVATEVRHLQRTEVLEMQEPFKVNQRGSSAMPHKKNPILCERLCGMSRLLRGYVSTSIENINLWHERDISHSSTERVILPDSNLICFYMLKKVKYLVDNLIINYENINGNFNDSHNLIYSQKIMLKLIEKGLTREKSYKTVQNIAMDSWNNKIDFKKLIKEDDEVSGLLTEEEFKEIFNPEAFLKNINEIYKRFSIKDGGKR
jgi:adenylosuccinate lyase